MIQELRDVSQIITINEINSLDSSGIDWPETISAKDNTNADIYIDNISYTDAKRDLNRDGLPDDFSFSESSLWELMNAYGRTILGVSEEEFAVRNFSNLRDSLDRTQDPFPFRTSPRLYRDRDGRLIPE
jgi:hypothetical protein